MSDLLPMAVCTPSLQPPESEIHLSDYLPFTQKLSIIDESLPKHFQGDWWAFGRLQIDKSQRLTCKKAKTKPSQNTCTAVATPPEPKKNILLGIARNLWVAKRITLIGQSRLFRHYYNLRLKINKDNDAAFKVSDLFGVEVIYSNINGRESFFHFEEENVNAPHYNQLTRIIVHILKMDARAGNLQRKTPAAPASAIDI